MIIRKIMRVFRLLLVIVAGAAVGLGGYWLMQERVEKAKSVRKTLANYLLEKTRELESFIANIGKPSTVRH